MVTRLGGFAQVTLRGPVTQAATIDCPVNGHWLAIRFRVGTYFPGLATARLLDHRDLHLPTTKEGRFWFEGDAWEIPGFTNRLDPKKDHIVVKITDLHSGTFQPRDRTRAYRKAAA
jgi:hypothetical protein